METNDYEYRFKDVIDLDTREVLFTVEHETRSQTNPMYGRAAHQPQSGADQPGLQARPRQHVLGDAVMVIVDPSRLASRRVGMQESHGAR